MRRLAEAARARGHLVDVICLRHGAEPPYEECNGVAVYRVPLDRGFGQPLPLTVLGWLRFLLLAAWTVTRLHFRKRYDVIQVHNMPDFLAFAALIPRLFGARVILEVQDASPELMAVKAHGPAGPKTGRTGGGCHSLRQPCNHCGWPSRSCCSARRPPPQAVSHPEQSRPPLFPPLTAHSRSVYRGGQRFYPDVSRHNGRATWPRCGPARPRSGSAGGPTPSPRSFGTRGANPFSTRACRGIGNQRSRHFQGDMHG
ncbi:MAG: glycosyltransferase [Thermogemmatispora sp.]|nr:glycosyltransferase [Thermogemmatispora sp.]